MRHPVYGGVLLLALGWSLAEAPLALVPTALLALVFDLKSRREEVWLRERYPEYAAYAERTRSRFIPRLRSTDRATSAPAAEAGSGRGSAAVVGRVSAT